MKSSMAAMAPGAPTTRRLVNRGEHILVDSDFWLALSIRDDANKKQATELVAFFADNRAVLNSTNLVIGEVGTVLSHRLGQEAARDFLNHIDINVIHVPESLDSRAIELFVEQDQRGTSYVDCANVAVMEALKLPFICAFDRVYHKRFDLPNIAYEALHG